MTHILTRLALTTGLFLAGMTRAAEPAKPEQLPPPRAVAPPAPRIGKPIYFYPRVSRYEVWQNYGVSRTGYWRPLVIQGPYGAYYRYNLEPFPWTVTHSGSVMPIIVD
jgi:hypothetical protein